VTDGGRHGDDGRGSPTVAESSGTWRLREISRRVPLAHAIEGAAIAVALWCILFAFQLLPGTTADTTGVWVFALAGIIIGASPFRRALLVVLAIASATVLVVTLTSLSNAVASRWTRGDQLPDSVLPAVVVLSGSVNPNNTINSQALDNLITGLRLIRDGRANVLVTTTVEEKFPGAVVTSTVDQSRTIGLFAGGARWIHTPPVQSTRDEALKSAELLLPQGIRRIAVVAAPMHTRRACSAFEAVGFDVTCVPSLVRSPGGMDPGPWPADRVRVFGDWIYEVLATAKYRARGWITSRPVRRNLPTR
jgi:uncharacterized SAM-binding protein YcdF (DUF218 family)